MNRYTFKMQEWGADFDILFHYPRRPGKDLLNLYPLLGISRTSHIEYLNGSTKVPEYIQNAIELFDLIPVDQRFKRAAVKLAPDGLKGVPLKKVCMLCIEQWEIASGLSLSDPSGVEHFSGDGSWTPYKLRKSLIDVTGKDPSGTAAALLIERQLEQLEEYVFARRSGCKEANAALCKLKWCLSLGQLQEFKQAQVQLLRDCVMRLKPELSESEHKYLASLPMAPTIDAERSFGRFKKVTATSGSQSNERPVYSKLIFQFESVSDLVNQMARLPTGFALCLIKEASAADSFFVFVVKNGDNLHLLTDAPHYEYPLQAQMLSKRNARYNEDRVSNSYFPYHLLKLVWSDNGRSVSQLNTGTDIICSTGGPRVIGDIEKLPIENILWLVRIFDLCLDRYFVGNVQEPTLALPDFSAIQVTLAGPRESKHELAKISSTRLTPLKLPDSSKLTRKALNKVIPKLVHERSVNKWMEDKFAPMVDTGTLYLPPNTLDPNLFLEHKPSGSGLSISQVDIRELSYWEKQQIKAVELYELPKTAIQTADEYLADSLFIGRYNQAQQIRVLAKADYEESSDKVLRWVYRKMAQHLPNIIDDLVSLNHAAVNIRPMLAALKGTGLIASVNYRQVHILKCQLNTFMLRKPAEPKLEVALGTYQYHSFSCYLSGEEDAKYRLALQVENACDLSLLTGLPIEKLPPQLRTYGLTEQTRPALLLDTHDPLECVSNPWDALKINYLVPVCIKALNRRRKELGLSAIKASELPVNYWEPGFEYSTYESVLSAQRQHSDEHDVVVCLPNARHRPSFSYV